MIVLMLTWSQLFRFNFMRGFCIYFLVFALVVMPGPWVAAGLDSDYALGAEVIAEEFYECEVCDADGRPQGYCRSGGERRKSG